MPLLRPFVRNCAFLYQLLQNIEEGDVIHCLTASGSLFYLSAPVIWVGRQRKCRVIINYHGAKAEEFWRESAWLPVSLLKQADVSLVASAYIARILSRHNFESEIVPNWIDISQFSFRERRTFGPNLLYARQIERMYRVEGILNAFQYVQAKYSEAKLGIVGSGTQLPKMKRLVARMGLRNVTFYGKVPHEKIETIFDRYDFLLNSTLSDNYPSAILEAACRGLINVAYGSGGIPDMIRNGETGVLVPVKDDLGLAEAVMRLIEHQDAARSMARRAREWAVEEHAWPKIFSHLMRVYGMADELRGARQPGVQARGIER